MPDQPETCRVCKVTIPLLFRQISYLFTVPSRFYESLNEQNQMHLSHIQSRILYVLYYAHTGVRVNIRLWF